MTRTVRTPARLVDPQTQELLASGIAVIWGDDQEWGGIFEAPEHAATLRAAAATQPLVAQIHTEDGRVALISLAPSAFVADGEHPLTFRGQGEIDMAQVGEG
jgi:hypothetical protein